MIEAEYRLRALKQANPNMTEAEERVRIIELARVTIEEADKRTADARRDQWFALVGGSALGAWLATTFPVVGEAWAGVVFGGICVVNMVVMSRKGAMLGRR